MYHVFNFRVCGKDESVPEYTNSARVGQAN